MSSISSSLPSGLQDLVNSGLLPSNLTSQQVQDSTPAELTQTAIDNVELTTVSGLLGDGTSSSSSDTVSQTLESALLGQTSSTSNTDSLIQALDSNMLSGASNSSSTSESTASDGTGSLFSYMG